jgi:ubiquinone/menaquinone biosynthesis C-methylase UbiE
VLDLGCGAGRVALALAAAGHAATGVDRSEPMLTAARVDAAARGLEADFVAADVVALPFDAASFDAAVFAQNGLGHLDAAGKRAALAEVRRVLRPGGRVLLSFRTPYAVNRLLPGLLARRVRPSADGLGPDEAVEAHGYVHRPSAGALRRATVGAGLRPVALESALTLDRRLPLGPLTPYVGGQFFLVAEA